MMALDRWIALIILLIFVLYGYTAFFMMDDLLPPILMRNPIWPSSFPKVLSIAGVIVSLIVLSGFEKFSEPEKMDINYKKLLQYKLFDAVLLIGLMVGYAFLLRPLGFIFSTFLFLSLGSYILGERKYFLTMAIASFAAIFVWYLVDQVLGIYLTPLPGFLKLLMGG